MNKIYQTEKSSIFEGDACELSESEMEYVTNKFPSFDWMVYDYKYYDYSGNGNLILKQGGQVLSPQYVPLFMLWANRGDM